MTTIDLDPIFALPVAQRFEVLGAIWDSLAKEPAAGELTDELKVELKRRLDAYRADPSRGIPWEEVKAGMLARRRKDAAANPDDCVPWELVRDAAAARRQG